MMRAEDEQCKMMGEASAVTCVNESPKERPRSNDDKGSLHSHEDEHSSSSATEALSDSECSGGQSEEQEQPVTRCASEEDGDSRTPELTDLSYLAEVEEEECPNSAQQDEDDDDKSQDSASTLLSDLSSVDETCYLDRLDKDLELRNRILLQFVADKDPVHVRIVKEYEESMRKALHEHYEQMERNAHTTSPSPSVKPLRLSFLQRLSPSLLLNETARGFASLLFYCIAHLSCWEITTAVLYECTKQYERQWLLHLVLLFTSLVLLRMSGGVFGWLDRESYELAQSLCYSAPDARVLRWFRRRPNLKATVNMVAFYICWTSVAYFQTCGLHLLDKRDSVAEGLPSNHVDVITSVKDKLVSGFVYEEEVLELEELDYAYLEQELSISSYMQLMGDDSAAVVSTRATILFFAVAAAMSIAVLRFKLGYTVEI